MEDKDPKGSESPEAKAARRRVNLEKASILLMDTSWGVELLSRIFQGFGARRLYRCRTPDEAASILTKMPVDLIVTEAMIEEHNIYEFVRSIRQRTDIEPNRFVPVIVLSAHTPTEQVAEARDCGANFLVAKPLSPRVVMDRVLWVANGKRKYLETDTYAGPDRRFRDEPPPAGVAGRRKGDPKFHVDEVQEQSA